MALGPCLSQTRVYPTLVRQARMRSNCRASAKSFIVRTQKPYVTSRHRTRGDKDGILLQQCKIHLTAMISMREPGPHWHSLCVLAVAQVCEDIPGPSLRTKVYAAQFFGSAFNLSANPPFSVRISSYTCTPSHYVRVPHGRTLPRRIYCFPCTLCSHRVR
jgi:hypothetical protein